MLSSDRRVDNKHVDMLIKNDNMKIECISFCTIEEDNHFLGEVSA